MEDIPGTAGKMEEGRFKLPLEVKDSFTERGNDFCKMVLVGEERRRQERKRVCGGHTAHV